MFAPDDAPENPEQLVSFIKFSIQCLYSQSYLYTVAVHLMHFSYFFSIWKVRNERVCELARQDQSLTKIREQRLGSHTTDEGWKTSKTGTQLDS